MTLPFLLASLVGLSAPFAVAQTASPARPPAANSVAALPSLDVPAYMGTWYQVAWFPNRFQKQCISDTRATYKQRADGNVDVLNRCKTADGKFDEAQGLARPAGSVLEGSALKPAQLEVSFLPRLLRWLPIWGSYWVLKLADDGRYAVIGEPTREYLWVLSRAPALSATDETEIRSLLIIQGYDLGRWQAHAHTATAR